ncbi:MAG: S9 family peptidase [Phycisphaerae bacterium]|nr:alpha/beta fold hydrolase [Phycisphaerae bacterium]NUQ47936.1 S9 family peptidase [Phycisphaerae bacterium]
MLVRRILLSFPVVAVWLIHATPARSDDVKRHEIGQVLLEDVPEVPAALRERMNQFLNVRAAGLLDFDDTGEKLLISTRFGNTNQLHLVTQPGGARRQLTFFDEPVRGAAFVPGTNARRILYSMDRGGSENNQIYLLDLADGGSTMLTDGASKNDRLTVARNGKRFAFCSTARNGRDYDIYIADAADPKPRRVWDVSGMFAPIDFSADGSKLTVLEYISEKVSRLHLFDVAVSKASAVSPPDHQFAYSGGAFSADGKHLFFTSDRDGQFHVLYRRDLAGGTDAAITPDLPWDVESIAVSPAGNFVAFTTNEDGQSKLYLMKPDATRYDPVTSVPMGLIGGLQFSHDGRRLGFTLNTPSSPGDVYVFTPADGKLTRWTESEIGGLNPDRFVTPTRIAYPTFDEVGGKPRMIPAYYYKPKGSGPFPVVISIHGGPEAQYQPSFSSVFQFWAAELGFAVVAPNVRGSTGYGRDYHMLDDGMKREDSVRDIGALLDWIEKQADLDSRRVAVYGGSYGGYMVLACLTNYPGRIKAGVDIVGIASFITFLEKTAPYRQDLRRAEYGDERDPEMRAFFQRISPLNNADKITAALYVQHGANDPRVPAYEAEQIVQTMRKQGRTVWYMLARDEGHGFAKKENRDLAILTATMFLEDQLKQ